MANEKNLLKGDERHKFTPEEHSKGGKASAIARKNKKDLREMLEILLEKSYTNKNGETIDGTEVISTALMKKAMQGDIRAFETIRDTVGQKPVERVMISEVDQSVIDEVEKAVLKTPTKTKKGKGKNESK